MMAGCTSAPKQENEDAPETEEAQKIIRRMPNFGHLFLCKFF